MRKNTARTVGCSFLLLLLVALSFGCASKSRGISDTTASGYGNNEQVDKRVRDYLEANDEDDYIPATSPKGKAVIMRTAKAALGTPYVRGGTNTAGFDCSGFVQWTFNHVGVKLPRTAREQSRVGRAIRNIDEMQVGDIVAFRHPKRGYHTGIYVGEGKFIHSPRRRTTVRINALTDPYFRGTFLGARRVGVSSDDDFAAAEKLLADYRVQEKKQAVLKASEKRAKNSKKDLRKSNKNKKTRSVASLSSKSSSSKKSAVRTRDKDAKDKSAVKRKASENRSKKSVSSKNTGKNAKNKAKASSKSTAKSNDKIKKSADQSKKASKDRG